MAKIAMFSREAREANVARQKEIREARQGVKRLVKPTADSGRKTTCGKKRAAADVVESDAGVVAEAAAAPEGSEESAE